MLGKILWTFGCFGVVAFAYILVKLTQLPERPEIKDGWWGRGPHKPDTDTDIRKFEISVDENVLVDLKERLQKTRYGEDLENTQFQYGFQVGYMKTLVKYWMEEYDWRVHEAQLNTLPHFKTSLEGIELHFIHSKPEGEPKTAKPLLMMHGWPGSIYEFYKIIPLLNKHGFEVVCPSIPGFGFSEASHQQGFDQSAAAHMFLKLMRRLGHETFYVQGGDWGGVIASIMAEAFPSNVLGIHSNGYGLSSPSPLLILKQLVGTVWPSLVLKAEDHAKWYPLMKNIGVMLQESGYFHVHATKPDTVGFSLIDSPVGLAAWILEKVSVCLNQSYTGLADGGLTKGELTLDEMLTNVMIYWVTATGASSARFYKEFVNSKDTQTWQKLPVLTPAGLASFPNEVGVMPEEFAKDKYKTIVQFTEMPKGGHFAAWEQPELLANDVKSFVDKVNKWYSTNNIVKFELTVQAKNSILLGKIM